MRITNVQYCNKDYPSEYGEGSPTLTVETRSLPFFRKKIDNYICYKVEYNTAFWKNLKTGAELEVSELSWKMNTAMALAQLEYMAKEYAKINQLKNNSLQNS